MAGSFKLEAAEPEAARRVVNTAGLAEELRAKMLPFGGAPAKRVKGVEVHGLCGLQPPPAFGHLPLWGRIFER